MKKFYMSFIIVFGIFVFCQNSSIAQVLYKTYNFEKDTIGKQPWYFPEILSEGASYIKVTGADKAPGTGNTKSLEMHDTLFTTSSLPYFALNTETDKTSAVTFSFCFKIKNQNWLSIQLRDSIGQTAFTLRLYNEYPVLTTANVGGMMKDDTGGNMAFNKDHWNKLDISFRHGAAYDTTVTLTLTNLESTPQTILKRTNFKFKQASESFIPKLKKARIYFISDDNAHTSVTEESIFLDNIIVPITTSTVTSLIDEVTKEDKIYSIFPNPSKGEIRVNSDVTRLQILDINGKCVFEKDNVTRYQSLDVSKLPAGVYLVKLFTENDMITKKLILER